MAGARFGIFLGFFYGGQNTLARNVEKLQEIKHKLTRDLILHVLWRHLWHYARLAIFPIFFA